ncbi:hypothetical protein [Polaribacter sp. HL-MS24]|uniref:hypothetical protein n=1 Tax=Polaribacter sp. HL-MS24 TaxID=3077735 RepID=UPI00293507D4|nr:hypothetical protein [Polaribacter sp. HL-MS24]WOC40133.1 hypothetical protein RRF69_11065 [Polaribacter sp. HL-MS24]
MKNLKSIIYVTLMLLMITACTSDNDNLKIESQQIDYESLNLSLKENIISFNNMLEYDESLSKEVDEFIETGDDKYFQRKYSKSSTEEIVYTVNELSDIYSDKQKEFLVNFYNELANSKDGYILDIVTSHKDLLTQQNFNSEEYEQIHSLLIASEQSILVLDGIIEIDDAEKKSSFSSRGQGDGFWDCMRINAGKAIGRGIVTGAIGGAISGAYYGATGGTVVLPGVGTATGAVGGAVFGAAGGATVGAIWGAIWTAVDCGGGVALKEFFKSSKKY